MQQVVKKETRMLRIKPRWLTTGQTETIRLQIEKKLSQKRLHFARPLFASLAGFCTLSLTCPNVKTTPTKLTYVGHVTVRQIKSPL